MKKLAVLLLASVLQVFVGAAASAADQFSLRYFGIIPQAHDFAKNVIASFEAIDKRSQGKLKIRYTFYGETPYKATDALAVLKNGQVDMTEWLPSYSAGTYPILAAPELPFILPSLLSVTDAQVKAEAAWAAPIMQGELEKIIAEHGATVLSRYFYEPMNFWFTTPVASAADLQGKRIRVFSPELGDLMTAFGASPVSLSSPEVYSALQRNSLSGVITGVGNIRGSKWDEVLRSGYVTNLMFASTSILVSTKSMSALPADLKSILLEEMKDLTQKQRAFMLESDTSKQKALATSDTFKLNKASDSDYASFRQIASAKVWPAWKSRAGGNAEAVLADILKAVEAK